MTAPQTDSLHILFASAEAAPFVKTGGLGDVAGSLPQALAAAGAQVIVMVPKYGTIDAAYTDEMEHLCDFYVPLGWRNEYCGLERLHRGGVDYLFIDNERYFKRSYPYGFFDDGERFALFSKAVVESIQHLPGGWRCDVLHCNDWHTAMAPVFLREFYQGLPAYEHVRTVFSIHNIAFQGQFSAKVLSDILGLAHVPAAAFQLTCGPDAINYMQGALNYTDAITTVSPTYAAEIQTPEYGEGLDGILRRRSSILHGIVNGIDTAAFDPAHDTAIAETYTATDRSGKAACKAALQQELGLEVRSDRPLMVMVTRLTRQKGLDLVTYALDRILSGGIQVAILGTGDTAYENALRYFEGKYPGTCAARIQFDPALSQRMYAGADLFLMPSLFEPCGLSQMIAMRYGTLPIVRETGGLRDTVEPYNRFTGAGCGFSFANFNGDEMADTVFRAARLFWDDRASWNTLVDHAMEQDFSWKRSADTYLELYRSLHPEMTFAVMDEDAEAAGDAAAESAAADDGAVSTDPSAAATVDAAETDVPDTSAAARTSARAAKTVETGAVAGASPSAPSTKAPATEDADTTTSDTATKPAAKKTTRATTSARSATATRTKRTGTAAARTKTAPRKKAASAKAATASDGTAKTAPAATTTPRAGSKTAAVAQDDSAKTDGAKKAGSATAQAAPSTGTKAAAAQPAATPPKVSSRGTKAASSARSAKTGAAKKAATTSASGAKASKTAAAAPAGDAKEPKAAASADGTKRSAAPDAASGTKADTKAAAKTGSASDTASGTKAGTKTAAKTGSASGAASGTKTAATSGSASGAKGGTKPAATRKRSR